MRDVGEATGVVELGELALPVGAEAFVGAAGADAGFEHGVEGAFDLLEVGGNGAGIGGLGGWRRGGGLVGKRW